MKLAWVAILLFLYTAFVIHRVMPQLPDRIPTSFNFQGRPTSGSSPDALWGILVAQGLGMAAILALPYVARRTPRLVHLGRRKLSDYPPPVRGRAMSIVEDLCGWMAVIFSLFLTLLVRGLIRAALEPGTSPSMWPVALYVAGTLGVVAYYVYQLEQLWKRDVAPNLRRATTGLKRS